MVTKRRARRQAVLSERANVNPKKVWVRFLRRRDVRDHNSEIVDTFLEGKAYELEEASASRWVESLGVAIYVKDEEAIADLADQVSENAENDSIDNSGSDGSGENDENGTDDSDNSGSDGSGENDENGTDDKAVDGDVNANQHSTADADNTSGKSVTDNSGKGKKPSRVTRKR